MILVIKDILHKREKHYPLKSVDDFDIIFEKFPRTHEIALMSSGLKDAAKKIANYISESGAFLTAWVVEDHGTYQNFGKNEDIKVVREKIAPKDGVAGFCAKLNSWLGKKTAKRRKPLPKDTSYTPDPGYQAETEPTKRKKFLDKVKQISESGDDN